MTTDRIAYYVRATSTVNNRLVTDSDRANIIALIEYLEFSPIHHDSNFGDELVSPKIKGVVLVRNQEKHRPDAEFQLSFHVYRRKECGEPDDLINLSRQFPKMRFHIQCTVSKAVTKVYPNWERQVCEEIAMWKGSLGSVTKSRWVWYYLEDKEGRFLRLLDEYDPDEYVDRDPRLVFDEQAQSLE
jgi:hypothetical protein